MCGSPVKIVHKATRRKVVRFRQATQPTLIQLMYT